MRSFKPKDPAAIEFQGGKRDNSPLLDAVARLIHFGEKR
mgnify:CR=1 FL=1|jgi:hypothetical protein|tara:strand:+ start:18049 stop:18165 length:117 start_codon:yes stop_codon:yes gene_type:complete